MPLTTIPPALREKLGEEATTALVGLINEATRAQHADTISLTEEKFEHRVTEAESKFERRVTELELKLEKRIMEVETKLDKRLTDEVAKLTIQISEAKAELMKWMFIFTVGQTGVLIGILFAFLRR